VFLVGISCCSIRDPVCVPEELVLSSRPTTRLLRVEVFALADDDGNKALVSEAAALGQLDILKRWEKRANRESKQREQTERANRESKQREQTERANREQEGEEGEQEGAEGERRKSEKKLSFIKGILAARD